MPEFLPGMRLNERFFHEVVQPILDRQYPGLLYSAGLIGWGSDVLGFDTPVSRDHLWGPRLQMFVEDANTGDAIHETLRQTLPHEFLGYSVHYSPADAADGGTRVLEPHAGGPVEHLVQFYRLAEYWRSEFGIAPDAALRPVDWLTFQEQRLATLAAGKLFHDGLGIEAVRARYAYYPDAVWRYLLAVQWKLISEEEAFVGRTDSVGDKIGSRLIAARLAERAMRLCFLMERRYAPYSKWFGTAFQRLRCAPQLLPLLEDVLSADTFAERDPALAKLYTALAQMHNELGLTPPLETRTRTYSGWHALRGGTNDLTLNDPRNTRPYQTIFGGRFADALIESIDDPQVRVWPMTGSVNQYFVESSDALMSVDFCRAQARILQQSEE